MKNIPTRLPPGSVAILALFSLIHCSLAQVPMLYSSPSGSKVDNYSGVLGLEFETGSSNIVVSHLGFFSTNGVTGLATSHNVAIFNSSLGNPQIIGQVVVPAGTAADWYTNNGNTWGFYYEHLDPPLLLASNTIYVLGGLVVNGDGDTWEQTTTPVWDTDFIGTAGNRHSLYGPGVNAWPPSGFSQNGTNNTYGVPNLANIPVGPAYVGVQTTNISMSAGQTLSILGFATGAPTITYQWYTNSLSTPLLNQTNAMLVISNATAANDGVYFLTASNSLGGEQSANVSVSVTAFPVIITQQPTNLTVFENYQANFYCVATGTPPISLQWSGDGSAIPGATGTNYSLIPTLSNNGEVYTCLASNYISGVPYTAVSSNATLTVIPNLALPQEILHGYNTNLSQNNFGGLVGGQFTVGNSPVTVTHLGYYAPTNQYTSSTICNLTQSHRVGIFNAAGTVLLGYVTVPAGAGTVVNGYIWAPLNPPLVLTNNTQYLLAAEVISGVDPWGNAYVIPDLNPYFATSCDATYWGAGWPGGGVAGEYGGQMYSAPNMAILAPTIPSAFILPTNVLVYAGASATLTAYVGGAPPVTLQWYTNGVALAGQTNLTLTLNNLTVTDSSSNYYVIVTSPGGSVQSGNGAVTVLPDTPSITQDIQPQTAFVYQTVQFTAAAGGPPPLSYQWTFDGNPIAGATNSTLTLTDVSSNNIGNYYLIVTNSYGSATSSTAGLTVEYPAAPGTYPSVVMGPNLLLYYPLNDYPGVATNWGNLGFAYDGTYVGACSSVAGPPQVNFGANDNAVLLDGLSACVQLPPLTNSAGATSVTVSNITIAAWVNDQYPPQSANAAIFFQRSTYTFGLSVNPDPNNGADALRYTWNGTGYNNFSGLDLPTNEWALVAMVISPTNSGLYLQYGSMLQFTNFAASNPSATFAGNSYIGYDTAQSTRYWAGPIGQVMVFDQALSPTAINALYYGILPSITLTITPAANDQLTVTWSGGTLLEATNLLGPWAAVPGTANGSGSYTTSPSNEMELYRVQQ